MSRRCSGGASRARAGAHILNIAFFVRGRRSTLRPRSAVACARCARAPLLLLCAILFGPRNPVWANLGPKWASRLRAVLGRAPRRGEVPVLDPKRPMRPGAPREAFEKSAGRGVKMSVSPARGARIAPRLGESTKIMFPLIHFGTLACVRCDLSTSPTRNAHFEHSPGEFFECSARRASRFWPFGVQNGLLASAACSIEHGAEARSPFWAQNGPNRPRRVEKVLQIAPRASESASRRPSAAQGNQN